MSPLRDEYEREASYAMEMADQYPTEELRVKWLRLARKWLEMLPHRRRTSKEDGINLAVRHSLGQKGSDASHG